MYLSNVIYRIESILFMGLFFCTKENKYQEQEKK